MFRMINRILALQDQPVSASNEGFDQTDITVETATSAFPSPWLMWLASLMFVLFQFCLQLSAGVMIGDLIQTFHLTPIGAGLLSGSYYFIYVFMQTPAGILVDRVGPRRLLSVGAIICSMGCGLFALSPNLPLACLARVLMGGGSSFAFVSTLYLIGKWFPKERFSMMTGLTETIGMIGTLTGNVLLAYLLRDASWRDVMWDAMCIALILGFLCYGLIRDRKTRNTSLYTPPSMTLFFQSIVWMLKQPGLWLNGLYSGLIFSVVTVFAALWSLPFLMAIQHISLSTATFETAFVFVGIGIGGPIMGVLYQRLTNRFRFLSIAALISAGLTSWIIYATPDGIALTALLFFLLGIMCSSYIFNYTLAKESTPEALHATSIGFTNTICMITAPILQPFVGWLLYLGLAQHNTAEPLTYSIANYHWALAIIPVNQLMAAVIALVIPIYMRTKKHHPTFGSRPL